MTVTDRKDIFSYDDVLSKCREISPTNLADHYPRLCVLGFNAQSSFQAAFMSWTK